MPRFFVVSKDCLRVKLHLGGGEEFGSQSFHFIIDPINLSFEGSYCT